MQRIQRKRSKGWRLPAGAVTVCRPGTYGNPYPVGQECRIIPDELGFNLWPNHRSGLLEITPTIEQSLALFRLYAEHRLELEPTWLDPLIGKNDDSDDELAKLITDSIEGVLSKLDIEVVKDKPSRPQVTFTIAEATRIAQLIASRPTTPGRDYSDEELLEGIVRKIKELSR